MPSARASTGTEEPAPIVVRIAMNASDCPSPLHEGRQFVVAVLCTFCLVPLVLQIQRSKVLSWTVTASERPSGASAG